MKQAPLTLFAYTQTNTSAYPGYVNLSLHEGERHCRLTVRTPGQNGTQIASVPAPDEELRKLRDAIDAHLASKT